MKIDRREFLKIAGMGSAVVVFGAGVLEGAAKTSSSKKKKAQDDFFFIQISDTHWGFSNPNVNPDSGGVLKKAVAAINSMKAKPDFVMVTGDITHTTDDPQERRKRMKEAKEILGGLNVKSVRFMPGEHDAGLDKAAAYREFFGETHYYFMHKGVHFIAIDNVSNPESSIGDAQLRWLKGVLKKIDKKARIVVFTHRPLFDLYQQWDWWTSDGAKAIEILKPYKNVVVFYGHIHQVNHHTTGTIEHHAAAGMMYPLPAPGSVPKKAPVPWDKDQPYKGLGYRGVTAHMARTDYAVAEYPITAKKRRRGESHTGDGEKVRVFARRDRPEKRRARGPGIHVPRRGSRI